MKKKIFLLSSVLLLGISLASCNNNQESPKSNDVINPSNPSDDNNNPNSEGEKKDDNSSTDSPEDKKDETPDVNPDPVITPEVNLKKTLSEIKEMGESLNEGEVGAKVEFSATYVKAITDNLDKQMLFIDSTGYLTVRVSGGFNDYLANRYTNCDYKVVGNIIKTNGLVEVSLDKNNARENLTNITSTPSSVDYSKTTINCASISKVYDEIKKVSLNNKYTGIGSIVTFKGVVLSTDRSDANSKAVLYDNNNVITVINDKKIVSATDIDNEFTVTGIISVLKGAPAILVLDIKDTADEIVLDYTNTVSVTPSYFSKWYHISDKYYDPSYDDFSKLYTITGYIAADNSRTSAYSMGMTDSANGNLSDTSVKTSIKGVYFMNFLNIKANDLVDADFVDAYENQTKVSYYASLYQFDTQNHGWKMFIKEDSIKIV